MQILCTFLGVFSSDMLPRSVTQFGTVIINADPHTEKGSHWLAVHFLPKSSSAYSSDSYDIIRPVLDIADFIRRNSTVWDYNMRQLRGLTNKFSGKYCCLFALYMDRGFTAKQFVGQFDGASSADRQISDPLFQNSGRGGEVTAAADITAPAFYKR